MPTNNDKKLDARIAKTLHAIEHAFFAMLRQKNYDDITIADILQQANINRTTFYKYYSNKHDLAGQMAKKLKDEFFVPALERRFNTSWEQFSQHFAELLQANHTKIALLWGIITPSTNLKQECYHLVKDKYQQIHHTSSSNPELQSHLYASLTLAMMDYIIENGIVSPDDIRHSLQGMLQGMLD